jgi:Cu/Ag efflux protein CusF
MKLHIARILSLPLALMVSWATIAAESETSTQVKPGVPGGEVIQTTKIKATVTAIDANVRKITFVTPKDEKLVLKVCPEVVNFDQIKIGDQLLVTATEQVVIRMADAGEKIGADGGTGVIGLAPVGAKPGLLTAETLQITATVAAIDSEKRIATLQFEDGTSKIFPIRKDVDLSKRKVGEKVIIQVTEAFAILIEKP